MEAGLFLAGLVVGLVVGAAGMRLLGTRPAPPSTAPPAPAGPPAATAPPAAAGPPPAEPVPGPSEDAGGIPSQALLDLDADASAAPQALSEESSPGTLSESSARLTEELERRYRGKRAEGPAEPRRGGGRRGPRQG